MWGAIISAVLGLISSNQNQSNDQNAAAETKQLYNQQTAYQKEQDRFSQGTQAMNTTYNMNKDQLQQVADVLNKNEGLKAQVMGNWRR